jgi:PKD repeat protein
MKYFLFAAVAVVGWLGWTESDSVQSSTKRKIGSGMATNTTSIQGKSAEAPIAKFKLKPRHGTKKTKFEFDASKSRGAIQTYNWDFGDGTTGTGKNIEHQYQANGKYKVYLTVDDGVTTDYRKKTIRIAPPDDGGGDGGGGGSTDGKKCAYTNPPRDTHFFKVISQDEANKTIIAEFKEPSSCSDVFYLCGDVRIGGIKPGQKEYWIGVICEMWDLGNNRFRIHLTGGKYWVDTGETGTYVWPQYDCEPSEWCSEFGY